MKTRVKMLKVKIKSLAEEARIIRLEERRSCQRRCRGRTATDSRGKSYHVPGDKILWPGDAERLRELHAHRTTDVRAEQRHSLLAYGFLRGRSYAAMEPNPKAAPDWTRVRKLVEKFGTTGWLKEEKAAQAEAFGRWAGLVKTAA